MAGKVQTHLAVHNVGVTALARELGVKPQNISWHFARGTTADQLRAKYAAQGGPKRVSAKVGRSRKPKVESAEYVPKFNKPKPASAPAQAPATAPAPETAEEVIGRRLQLQAQRESMEAARVRKMIADADAAELANEETRRLVPIERVRRIGEGIVKKTVEVMVQIPGNTQDRLAAETDPVRCGQIVMEQVRHAVDTIRGLEELWDAG